MDPLRHITFVVNSGKPGAREYAERLCKSVASALDNTLIVEGDKLCDDHLVNRDACCVIGGDGTILGVVKPAVKFGVPVIGINYGKLGFLTTYTQQEADECLIELIVGNYEKTSRALLRCQTTSGEEALALNDIVVKSAGNSGLVSLRVSENGHLVNTFYSDGLIFSTPTGSTAYNLAAGGPIIHPGAHVLAMTPISPHTLSNRSIVLPSETQLQVDSEKNSKTPHIFLDGRLCFEDLDQPFPIHIQLSEQRFSLLHRKEYNHFSIVRNKLKW